MPYDGTDNVRPESKAAVEQFLYMKKTPGLWHGNMRSGETVIPDMRPYLDHVLIICPDDHVEFLLQYIIAVPLNSFSPSRGEGQDEG